MQICVTRPQCVKESYRCILVGLLLLVTQRNPRHSLQKQFYCSDVVWCGIPQWTRRYSECLTCNRTFRLSQWPRGVRRRSAAAHLLRLWVRIPPGAWMSVCCERCLSSGKRSVRWADRTYGWVLPTVVCRCVWSKNLVNEKALAHSGALAPK